MFINLPNVSELTAPLIHYFLNTYLNRTTSFHKVMSYLFSMRINLKLGIQTYRYYSKSVCMRKQQAMKAYRRNGARLHPEQ